MSAVKPFRSQAVKVCIQKSQPHYIDEHSLIPQSCVVKYKPYASVVCALPYIAPSRDSVYICKMNAEEHFDEAIVEVQVASNRWRWPWNTCIPALGR